MTNYFINSLNEKEKKEKYKNNLIFGYSFGIVLFLLSILFFIKDIFVYKITFVILFLDFLATVIYPNLLEYPKNFMSFIFNFIGTIILDILLSIVYIIYIVPVGIVLQIINNKKNKNIKSTFVDKEKFVLNVKKSGRFKVLYNIVKLFTRKEFIMFLPLIIILIILGLILLFAESSYVSPFIYPLF